VPGGRRRLQRRIQLVQPSLHWLRREGLAPRQLWRRGCFQRSDAAMRSSTP
jgi:hypothetical protein